GALRIRRPVKRPARNPCPSAHSQHVRPGRKQLVHQNRRQISAATSANNRLGAFPRHRRPVAHSRIPRQRQGLHRRVHRPPAHRPLPRRRHRPPSPILVLHPRIHARYVPLELLCPSRPTCVAKAAAHQT